jgi:hypothetical protein
MWLSWLRSIGTIERKKLIKFRRRVGQPVIVTDSNHPPVLKSPRALATVAVGPIRTVSIVSPSFEARIVTASKKIQQQ